MAKIKNSILLHIDMARSVAKIFGLFLLHNCWCSKLTIVVSCLLFCTSDAPAQTTYYTKATGALHDSSTWMTATCGTNGQPDAGPPTATDNIVICNSHTLSIMGGVTINDVTITSGGTFDFSDVIINGDLTIDEGGTGNEPVRINGDYTVNGTHVVGGMNTVTLTGSGTNIGGTGTVSQGTLELTTGDKTILSSTNLTVNKIVMTGSITVTNQGTITAQAEIDGSTGSTWINDVNSVVNIGRNGASFAQITLIASANPNTVNYSSTGAQTIKTPSGTPGQYHHLTLSTSGTKTMDASLDINGNLTLSGTAELDVTSTPYNITLGGNWVNNSTYSSGPFNEYTGKVTFNGSTTQTIGGTISDETFYDLEVNNTSAGGILLQAGSNITITNLLTLTDGNIDSKTNLQRVNLPAGSNTNGGSVNSFIQGSVKKTGNTAFVFPTGDGTVWARIAMSAPSAATDVFTAQYVHAGYGSYQVASPLINVSTNEYWTLTRTVGTSNVTVKLYWQTASNSEIDNCLDLTVAHWNSGTNSWDEKLGTATGTCSGSGTGSVLTDAVVTTFSPFTFGSKSSSVNPLPIVLLYFDAKLNQDEGKVNLEWATASESNNDYFTVERSIDGIDFEMVTNITGAGNSNEPLYYFEVDPDPYHGISSYRLKQTDYDGNYEYSKMVKVNYITESTPFSIAIYPNPTTGLFTLTNLPQEPVRITVYNALGDLVHDQGWTGSNDRLINLTGLSEGLYYLQVFQEATTLNRKVIKLSITK